MKYVVILGDGMADYPVEELQGKTPLEVAAKPNMDLLAQKGEVGLVKTIPDGMTAGSDTANLSVMGYAPEKYYSGRSPLEAASIGVALNPEDVTYRCNFVTLSDTEHYEDATMLDYSAGEISTEEARELIEALSGYFQIPDVEFYAGVSYRHCLVLRHADTGTQLTPPHDISLKPIAGHLPQNGNSDLLYRIMKESRSLLEDHPVNKKRIAEGKNPANSVWFWGEGRKPALPLFKTMHGLNAAVISAVDLIKGIAKCAEMQSIDVPGATGNVDTNFAGKAQAAVDALKNGADFVYVHMEAPDECGHRHEVDHKILAIEKIDSDVVGKIIKELQGEDYSMLILPDHPTPLCTRTHAADPVPYMLYRSNADCASGVQSYTEKEAEKTGVFVSSGPELLKKFLQEL